MSFTVGSDPDLNTVNVTNRVNQALARLPPEVQRNGVIVKKQSSALLQLIAVHSPKGSRDGQFLSNYATIEMLDNLRRVPGVGDAVLFGPLDYAMRAWVSLDRMASLDISTDDIIKAIQSQNIQAAAGRVRVHRRPVGPGVRLLPRGQHQGGHRGPADHAHGRARC